MTLDAFTEEVGDIRYKLPPTVVPKDYQEVINILIKKSYPTLYAGGESQCAAGKSRSLVDITRTALHHFDVSIEEILKYIASGLKNNKYSSLFCPDIRKRTIYPLDVYCDGYTDGFYHMGEPDEDDDDPEDYMGYQDKHYHLLKSYQ